MRRASIVVGALLVALTIPLVALAGPHVPFKGADAGEWGIGAHDCGALVPVFVETSGQATHVGSYDYSSQECVEFAPSGLSGEYSGTWTLTAANGDTIEGTYAGTFQVVGSDIQYEQVNAVGGGTGRFAEADGSFQVSGLASLVDFSDLQVLDGAISSVGSSK
jgi:hypothetical protein